MSVIEYISSRGFIGEHSVFSRPRPAAGSDSESPRTHARAITRACWAQHGQRGAFVPPPAFGVDLRGQLNLGPARGLQSQIRQEWT